MATKKLKVLFFITALPAGGAERVMLCILRHLDREAFVPHLALLKREGDLIGNIPEDVVTHNIGMEGCSIGKEMPALILRLRKTIREINPDVVLSFLWDPNIINLAANLIFKHTKVIISERCALHLYFESTFGSGIKRRIATGLTKFLYSTADHIITVSKGIKGELIAMGLPSAKITDIQNPIDISLIDRLRTEVADINKPYILFAGRLNRQKNIPVLINAFNRLKDDYNIKLVILGRGEEEDNLKKLARTLTIEERVIFRVFTENPYKYMQDAEVFVLSSDYEGFPNVLLEAMACGVPAVSTDCQFGPREIIEDGKSGFLVPVGDSNAMAAAIRNILDKPGIKEQVITEGLRRVKSMDAETVVKRYEKLIYEVCKRNTRDRKIGENERF